MRLLNFINEKYLKSEISFGFELEAICRNSIYYDELRSQYLDVMWGSSNYDLSDDSTIEDFDEKNEISFEFKSPVMQFTPLNIQNSIKFLDLMFIKSNEFYTNRTCGFHVHFSLPKMSKEEIVWLYLNMCLDDEFLDTIKYLNDIKFFNGDFANFKFLKELRNAFSEYKHLTAILSFVTDSKNNVIRLHPQGTIEWRGPRNFLNTKDINIIKDFFKKLDFFVKKLIIYSNNKILLNKFKRDDIYSHIKNSSHILSNYKNS